MEFNKTNTFCINLEKSTERWKRMSERFTFFQLQVSRWNASTPDTLIDTFNIRSSLEKACAQSHICIWKHMVSNEIPYAFIMEDDIKFHKDWKKILNELNINDMDMEWDMILLNGFRSFRAPHFTWTKIHYQMLTGAYIISIRGVKKILEHFKDNYIRSDHMTKWLQIHHHSYSYYPWLIVQEYEDSTLNHHPLVHKKNLETEFSKFNYSLEPYI